LDMGVLGYIGIV